MRSIVNTIAHIFGYEKDPNSPSNSEDDDDWGDDNPRITMIKEQLEYYFSGINLEKDRNFRDKIEESEDGSVPVEYFLNCNRMKYLNATPSEILEAGHSSQYLDADNEEKTIRSKEPFIHDPERYKKIIRVSGLGKKVPQYAQSEFFNSIFPGEIVFVYLIRNECDGELEYSNKSLVEFTTTERVNEVLDKGIVYGPGNALLDVQPYFNQNNQNRNYKRKHNQEQEEESKQSETETEQTAEEEEDGTYYQRPESSSSEEAEPPAEEAEREEEKVEDEQQQQAEEQYEQQQQAEEQYEQQQAEEQYEQQQAEEQDEQQQQAEEQYEQQQAEESAEQQEEPAKEEEEVEEKPTPRRGRTPKKKGPRGRAAKPSPRQ